MINYSIVDVKQPAEGEEGLSFCVVVHDDATREGQIFVYENLTFSEGEDGNLECGVNMTKLLPGSGIQNLDEISDEEQEFMQELLSQMVEDFVQEAINKAEAVVAEEASQNP